MDVNSLNRIGILLNFLAGFMLAPEIIGLERLKKFETSIKAFSERYKFRERIVQFLHHLEVFVKNKFYEKFSLQEVEKFNLLRFVAISLMLLIIPITIQALFLNRLYELISQSSLFNDVTNWTALIAASIFIGGQTVEGRGSPEPLRRLNLRESVHSLGAILDFLFFGFFRILHDAISLLIWIPLALIVSPLILSNILRGRKPIQATLIESLQKLQEWLFLTLGGLSIIFILCLVSPVVLPSMGFLGLLAALPIVFYKFIHSIVQLLEPQNSRLKSLLVGWGVLLFIVGNLLQFIATF